jgi:hypothetical protein
MPRSSTGIYTTPPGTDGVPGTTVESAKYNINVHDVETDLNAPRPVISGGTGATTINEATVNLQVERAYQVVTDYNSAVLLPGSFHSGTSASGSPVAGHEFSGIAYTTDAPPFPASSPPANSNMTLEARDQTSGDVPGVKYVRQRKGGVWGAWIAITETGGGGTPTGGTGGTGGIPEAPIDGSLYGRESGTWKRAVHLAGDTMTGDLAITKTSPLFRLNKSTGTNSASIYGQTNGSLRWIMEMSTSDQEAGGNSGSNWALYRCSDGGTTMPGSLRMNRATGSFELINMQNAQILMDCISGTGYRQIVGTTGGTVRWSSSLGDQTPETGSNKGSNYNLVRWSDTGGQLGLSHYIDRQTGAQNIYGTISIIALSDAERAALLAVDGQAFKPGGGPWAASSDARIKTVSGNYTKGVAVVKQLTPRVFRYKANDVTNPVGPSTPAGTPDPRSLYFNSQGKDFIGFIAQEVENILPELVTKMNGWIDAAPVSDLRSVDATALTYVLLNAVKELITRVETLETAP